ncbi:MAG: site-2 protease family protein [Chthoniobacteraceae bacterium]
MRWSFTIARILGIEVRVLATFPLLVAFYGFLFFGQGGIGAAIHGVAFICLVFLCVLLHEFGHAMAARRYGIHTPDITLLPIGGLARLERMPDKPGEELVVAVCGPLVNVVIFAILFPFAGSDLLDPEALQRFDSGLLAKLTYANAALVIFNLIPAFPMDGGRVLRSLLAMRMDYVRATNIAASIGQGLAAMGGLFALLNGLPLLALVALFVFFGAQSEAAHAQMRSISNGLRVRDAMITRFEALDHTATLHAACEAVLHTSQGDFPVVNGSSAVCGVLTRDDLIAGLRKTGPDTPIGQIMRTDVPSVRDTMLCDRAFAIMQESRTPALPVIDSTGKLVGLFTPENIGEFVMIQTALGSSAKPAGLRPPPLPVRPVSRTGA